MSFFLLCDIICTVKWGCSMIKKVRLYNLLLAKKYETKNFNTHSKLYTRKNNIYKIPESMSKETLEVIKIIDNIEESNVVEVNGYISVTGNIIGYSMNNYCDYKSLKELSDTRSLEDKINDSKTILKSLYKLTKNNLSYNDLHRGNFLINEKTNDMKICDIDGFIIEEDKKRQKDYLKEAISLCACYIFASDEMLSYYGIKYKKKKRENDIFVQLQKSVDKDKLLDNIDLLDKIKELNYIEYKNDLEIKGKKEIEEGAKRIEKIFGLKKGN